MKKIIIVAGGTAGHINAAIALGEEYQKHNGKVEYFTGKRQLDYKLFQGKHVHHIDAQPLRTNNPIKLCKNIFHNLTSWIKVLVHIWKEKPESIVGAGGYVCGPTLFAGWLLRIPIFIIEQNAIAGLTNRILGRFSKKIFVHFEETKKLETFKEKCVVTGNPTRSSIRPVAINQSHKEIRLLVFGGSLGAKQINEIIWSFIEKDQSTAIEIHHQIGTSFDQDFKVGQNVHYKPMIYIDDMQKEYEWADIILSRAGASTVSELRIVGKPCLIIPYPQATDNHQWENAMILKKYASFTVEVLETKINMNDGVKALEKFIGQAHLGRLNYAKVDESNNANAAIKILKEMSL